MDLGEDLGDGKAFYSMAFSPFIIIIIIEVCVFFFNSLFVFSFFKKNLSLFIFVLFLLG
jgi:hypothetical protein